MTPLNSQSPRRSRGGQLSLFQDEGMLPVPGWRGKTPPEMRADAPAGYRLDLSAEEPLYVLDDDQPPPASDERFDEDLEWEDGSGIDLDRDDDASPELQRYAPREWRPTAQTPSP